MSSSTNADQSQAPESVKWDQELIEIIQHLKIYEKGVRRFAKKHGGGQHLDQRFLRFGVLISNKIDEFIRAGKLEKAQRNWFDATCRVIQEISKIEGMGPLRAAELVEEGVTSIDDLYSHSHKLTRQQLIGIQHYADLNQTIPHQEAMELINTIQTHHANLQVQPTGAARRCTQQCNQVDCIIINPNRIENLLQSIIDQLIKVGLIIDTICLGDDKFTGVARLVSNLPARKLCIRVASVDEAPCMMLYYTGPESFVDRLMSKGLERALSITENCVRKVLPNGALGDLVQLRNEQEIFDLVGITYLPPEHRK